MSKNVVPCGGFELGDNLEIKDGKLDLVDGAGGGLPTGEAPYQQLVTDGGSEAKWEDRLAYDDSRVVLDGSHGVYFVHVSSNIPEGLTEGGTVTVWDNTGNKSTGTLTAVSENLFYGEFGLVALVDGAENSGITIPKRGIYFTYSPSNTLWISGVAFGEATEPEITWDGNIGSVKKLDEKYLPDPLILYELESGV